MTIYQDKHSFRLPPLSGLQSLDDRSSPLDRHRRPPGTASNALSPPSNVDEGGGGTLSVLGLSDPYSGDGYNSYEAESSPSGFPRTAFLNQDDISEDARLLQQILRESEEEIAASAADRANGHSGFGDGVGTADGYDDLGSDFDADPSLQSLDVDRIIESMELDAAQDGEEWGAGFGAGGNGIRIGSGSRSGATGVSLGAEGVSPWKATMPTSRALSASRRRQPGTSNKAMGSRVSDKDSVNDLGGVRDGGGGGGGNSEARVQPVSDGNSMGGAEPGSAASTTMSQGASLGSRDLPSNNDVHPSSSEEPAARVWEGEKEGKGSATRVSGSWRRSPGSRLGEAGGTSGGAEWSLSIALKNAEAVELRLLRGGNRDVVSPLQVWWCTTVRQWGAVRCSINRTCRRGNTLLCLSSRAMLFAVYVALHSVFCNL